MVGKFHYSQKLDLLKLFFSLNQAIVEKKQKPFLSFPLLSPSFKQITFYSISSSKAPPPSGPDRTENVDEWHPSLPSDRFGRSSRYR